MSQLESVTEAIPPNQEREESAENRSTQHPRSILLRRARLLFPLYLIIVLWGVLTKCAQDHILTRTYYLSYRVPLIERILYYGDIEKWIREMAAGDLLNDNTIVLFLNLLLLIPFGIFVMYFARRRSVFTTTLLGFFLCLGIEIVQLFTCWGAFSIADLVVNTVSAWIGARLFTVLYRPERERVLAAFAAFFLVLALPLALFAVIRTGVYWDFYLRIARGTLENLR